MTADLYNGSASTYEFGTIDKSAYSGSLIWVPIDNQYSNWTIDKVHYSIAGKPTDASRGTSVLLRKSSSHKR